VDLRLEEALHSAYRTGLMPVEAGCYGSAAFQKF
jgi:hypothetical protein